MKNGSRGPFKRLYIAGHTGLVGSALVRHFSGRPNLEMVCASRSQLDLTDAHAVARFLQETAPDAVILSAGRVGGIAANSRYPAQFVHENLMIEANVIHAAFKAGVDRLLNFGSACMYPKVSPQPMGVDQLMAGPLEPTSEPYAMAKLAGLSLCAAYRRQYGVRYFTAIPCTVYGPGDYFTDEDSHVLSALVTKFHEAREAGRDAVTLWGTGNPRREFLYADDLAQACELLLTAYEGPEPVNVGSGEVVSIRELALRVARSAGFQGGIFWDTSRPDGAAIKWLDSTAMRAMGWIPRILLNEGIERTVRWYRESLLMGAQG